MREGMRLLRRNWGPIALFELVYKLLSLAALTPLSLGLFELSLRAAGLRFLDAQNLADFLRHPVTILLLLLELVLLLLYVLADMCAIIYGLEEARAGRRVTLAQLVRGGGRLALRALPRGNVLLAFFVLLLLPLMNYGAGAGILSALSTPELLMDFLRGHRLLYLAYLALLVALGLLALRWLFSLHVYCLEKSTFRHALRRSAKLMRGHFLRALICLVLWNLAAMALLALLIVLAAGGALLICRIFVSQELLLSLLLSFVAVFAASLLLIWSCCSVPLSFSFISVLYYRACGLEPEPPQPVPERDRRTRRREKRVYVGLLLCAVAACSAYLYLIATGHVGLRVERAREISVTAHRGYSSAYPENSMSAFYGAVERGVDCIELDVRQLGDGTLVVLHDSSLGRTTGLQKNVWELTWEEASTLDCGSWFSADFAGEPLPTLAQVLEFAAEEHVDLNIELKPTKHDQNLAEAVVALVNEYDYADHCVVTSLNYDALEQVKACDPEITTVYVMSVAYGQITALEYADEFSVRYNFVTQSLVRQVHRAGKKLHVWTVNSRDTIERMIELDVDDIITDNPVLVQELIAASRTSRLAQALAKLLLE